MTRFKYPAGLIQRLKEIRGRIETPGARLAAALTALALLGGSLILLSQPRPGQVTQQLETAPATPDDIQQGGEETLSNDESAAGSVGQTKTSHTNTRTERAPTGSQTSLAPGGAIKLGVAVPSGDEGSVVGASRETTEDFKQIVKAMVQEINESGGLAGRPVEAVLKDAGGRGNASEQSQIQRNVCASFTQDEKVFMVLAFTGQVYAYDCYKNHSTPFLSAFASGDEEQLRKLSPWILPALTPTINKIARFFPAAMEEHAFLTKKMGILILELPGYRKVADEILIPEVESRGGKVIEKTYIPVTVQDAAAQSSSSVLRFQQAGVDRVILWAPGGLVWLLFARQAESQGYRPKYAITTLDQPELVSTPGPTQLPPEQLPGSVGAGWVPQLDVIDRFYPPTEREKACWSVINRRAGTNFSQRQQSKFNGQFALSVCELFYLSKAALAPAAPTQLSRSQVPDLFVSLGESYQTVTFPRVHFRRDSVDASQIYSRLKYFEDCTCFKYVSDWLAIP